MAKVPCPRCGQDWIISVIFKPLQKRLLVCPECDSFWWPDEEISMKSLKYCSEYVENMGYEPTSENLEEGEQIEV
jgi:hypothetical protein